MHIPAFSGEISIPRLRRKGQAQIAGASRISSQLTRSSLMLQFCAGNLAHMLNHSCQPNCYSRTIEVVNRRGQQEEHVVIIAKERIPSRQELTYDYRFSSSEILPCNCGAPNCCGLVNESGAADCAYLRVPADQLKPLQL